MKIGDHVYFLKFNEGYGEYSSYLKWIDIAWGTVVAHDADAVTVQQPCGFFSYKLTTVKRNLVCGSRCEIEKALNSIDLSQQGSAAPA